MNEIKLLVDDKNLETVLSILNNLKSGLITNIETNSNVKKQRQTQYQPKTNTIIKEENSGTADKSGKYVNPAAYKAKLKQRK